MKSFCSFSLVVLFCNMMMRPDSGAVFDFVSDLNDPITDDFLANTEFQTTSRSVDPAEIVNLLFNLKAPCLLAYNLYAKTYPLNKKSIIDVPAFFTARDSRRKSNFGMSLFFDQTDRMYFSQDCDGIQAYLALCNPLLLQRLSECAECAQVIYPNFAINPLVIFPLFRNITVQERQTGLMLHGDKFFNNMRLHVHVPVFYLERNYYMTQDERTCIENAFNEVLAPQNSKHGSHGQCSESCATDQRHVGMRTDKENPVDMAFVQNHLIGDQFGIGDMRVHLDWELIRRKYYKVALGLVATVPTAFAFKKGLFGSSFQNVCTPKNFNIASIVEAAGSGNVAQATAIGQAFALGALDEISHNLLNTGLGYGKHLGLGASYCTTGRLSFLIKRPWAHHIKMRSRMILQYYFPATEMRSFVEDKNPDDYAASRFDLDRVNNDPVYAEETLNFINEKFVQEMYPFHFRTFVYPHFIFQSMSSYYFELKGWKAQLGSDFWVKMQESFGSICVPPGTPPLAVDCAKRPAAMQSRISGLIAYSVPGVLSSWTFSLYGDKTYWSKGIGKDFNIVFNAECNF